DLALLESGMNGYMGVDETSGFQGDYYMIAGYRPAQLLSLAERRYGLADGVINCGGTLKHISPTAA
ncbi:MAG: hypothetical protein II868_07875, partial [Butyrivibrio sp.]|nr:hypothetical protein [Butyrivibrio sp.]